MAREKFEEWKPTAARRKLIAIANEIIDEWSAQGFDLSVRQLYYRLVAGGHVPNSPKSYKRVVDLMTRGRRAGMVDWLAITDRTRGHILRTHFNNTEEFSTYVPGWFHLNRWKNQPWWVEVMVEKDALSGVLGPVCRELDVPLTAMKGYASSSMMYWTAKRMQARIDNGQPVKIFYLGDHDPSGIDMDRDIKDRLDEYSWRYIEVERIALTMPQIEARNPPPYWAKVGDSRSPGYVARFGQDSWELDALRPNELREVVEEAVVGVRDEKALQEIEEREEVLKDHIRDFLKDFEGYDDDDQDV